MIPEEVFKYIENYCRVCLLTPGEFGIVCHPLTQSMHYISPTTNQLKFIANGKDGDEFYEMNFKRMRECETIPKLLFRHINKPFMIDMIIILQHFMTDEEFSDVLSCCWTLTEYPHQHGTQKLVRLFKRAKPEFLMDKEELDFFNNLPQKLQVYRGTQSDKAVVKGLSWTLDVKKAEWFTKRFNLNGKVYSATINKKDVFMYTNGRSEQEIVLNPRCLIEVKNHDV